MGSSLDVGATLAGSSDENIGLMSWISARSLTTLVLVVIGKSSLCIFRTVQREKKIPPPEIPEESEQFRFLRAACYVNIKGSVGLILATASAMRISIPLDLSSRSFIPPSRFMRSRSAATLLAPFLVFIPRRFA
jgi:hypothetical protein